MPDIPIAASSFRAVEPDPGLANLSDNDLVEWVGGRKDIDPA